MQRIFFTAVWIFAVLSSLACSNELGDCRRTKTCVGDGGVVGGEGGDAGGSGDGEGGDGGGGSGGHDPAGCEAQENATAAECVGDEFGLFVDGRAVADVGDGSRELPFASIAEALASVAGGRAHRVFVCADEETYAEAVEITEELDGIEVYGGFRCDDWAYDEALRTKLVSPEATAFIVRGLTQGLVLENFDIAAADATVDESSFGVVVTSSDNVHFRRVVVRAGQGGAGRGGENGAAGMNGAKAGALQAGVAAACPATAGSQTGGVWFTASFCGSKGGNGGPSGSGLAGNSGTPGIPNTNVMFENVDNSGANGTTGSSGRVGSAGKAGSAGTPTSGAGAFSAEGFVPSSVAGSGSPGSTAQGGGGGGASDAISSECLGASGAAGGMGGCGGEPGSGGAGGGASVALFSWMSEIELDDCTLIAAKGGTGGRGGDGGPGGLGQPGGVGGEGNEANGIGKGGDGGDGGPGGPGGPGAGGNGGPSYAIVYKGAEPGGTLVELVLGTPGSRGGGGTAPGMEGQDGLPGEAASSFEVP